jgi:hypothetical protein
MSSYPTTAMAYANSVYMQAAPPPATPITVGTKVLITDKPYREGIVVARATKYGDRFDQLKVEFRGGLFNQLRREWFYDNSLARIEEP